MGGDASRHGGPFSTDPKKDAVTRFVEWYNHARAHMSLDWKNLETPAHACERKMPPKGQVVIDEETGEEYVVK